MQNVFIAESFKRKIKWTVGGRIVHTDMNDNVISIEKYTKAALAKIVKFLSKKETSKTVASPKFNANATLLLAGINGFDMIEDNGTYFAVKNNVNPTNKLFRCYDAKGREILKLSTAGIKLEKNMRYEMSFENDGSVIFQPMEAVTPENLNTEYDAPLLNVYEC